MTLKISTMRSLTRCDSDVDSQKCGQALDFIEKQIPEIKKITDPGFKEAALDVLIDTIIQKFGLTREVVKILLKNQTDIYKILEKNEKD